MKNISGIGGLSADRLMAPLALQEMVFAIWLIAKGFRLSPVHTAKQQVLGDAWVKWTAE